MRNFPALGYMILLLQLRAYPGEHREGFTGEGMAMQGSCSSAWQRRGQGLPCSEV